MTKQGLIFLALVLPLVVSGCSEPALQPVPRAAYLKLQVGQRQLNTEVAYSDVSRRRGLMYRKALEKDSGMLFVFPRKKMLSFWMKNTLIPLSIAYIDDKGKVLQIKDMAPRDETSVASDFFVRYALEVDRGWYEKAGLKEGDSIPGFTVKVAPYLKMAN
ncbi:MAG: DUF192 domain-containing protein [Planctomycetota bacterium]|nr:DUF192 domain-containing protein [Planctomycetota bacterium]